MNDSYVAMATAQCSICFNDYETGEILVHKNLKNISKAEAHRGNFGMCPKCTQLWTDDYIALIVVENAHLPEGGKSKLTQQDAKRTGDIVHLRKEVFEDMFGDASDTPMVFIDTQVFEWLQTMATKGINDEEKEEQPHLH